MKDKGNGGKGKEDLCSCGGKLEKCCMKETVSLFALCIALF